MSNQDSFIKRNWIFILIACWATGGAVFYITTFHDIGNEMNKNNQQIINDMNCHNYGYWIHEREGDWLQFGADQIREKAQEVQKECSK